MKKSFLFILIFLLCFLLAACTSENSVTETAPSEDVPSSEADAVQEETDIGKEQSSLGTVTAGTEKYRDFLIDNVFHSVSEGDIHYNVYIPETYDDTKPYALYFTLPGYGGLYFQGVAANIKTEEFGFEAMKYNEEMIIVAPQLNDWGETSADQTIALVEYFLEQYNIDRDKVYGSGYSGGGETMSLVMGKRPDLFTAYLHVSSKWDGEYDPVIEQELPVYFAIGRNDEYYGSEPTQEAYNTLYALYEQKGFSTEKIDSLLVLDIKEHDYFAEQGISNEHGGGGSFAFDTGIMGWLFGTEKGAGHMDGKGKHLSGTVPEELEYIPEEYRQPSSHPGVLNKLTYQTWESFSYEEQTQELTKEAWIYLPYGYSEEQKYNVFYLSHGGWSNETTVMGTDRNPRDFKYVIDNAIKNGEIQPLIIVLPTYNNLSGSDSGDYSLALQLTDQFHNELVKQSGHEWNDFFIFSASGTDDFAYSAFKAQIMAMGNVTDGTFRFADNESEGNLAFLEREGYSHNGIASDEYTYNGLRFFWHGKK